MIYSEEFILKVNEVYHDIEQKKYENMHPDIFDDEIKRWRKIGKDYIYREDSRKINVLDIGSGTGFVPMQIISYLGKKDLLVCSDLSANILDVCKKNISSLDYECKINYLKLDGNKVNLKSNKFDFVTINAVLHHVPNLGKLFKEINRILKINGKLIIVHEPNKFFYNHKFLWINYKFVSLICNQKQFIIEVLMQFKLFEIIRNILGNFSHEIKDYNEIIKNVNKSLLNKGIIKKPITASQIIKIIDIHSPTAGGYQKNKGIDISDILNYLPHFKLEIFETYNHLCKTSSKNSFTKVYDSFLRKKYPNHGATFMAILKKRI